jgi:Signal peptidase, peptidase S26
VESDCPERKFIEKDPGTGFEVELGCSLEALGGSTNLRGEVLPEGNAPADVKTTVPEGQVWLVSDNRQFPWDSREFGPVPRETCQETVMLRLVSARGLADAKNRFEYIR